MFIIHYLFIIYNYVYYSPLCLLFMIMVLINWLIDILLFENKKYLWYWYVY